MKENILQSNNSTDVLQRNKLSEAWYSDEKDIKTIEMIVGSMSHRIRSNPEAARYHFDLVKEIADGELPIASAHMILMDCYRRGHGVEADPSLALHHLEQALEIGSSEARWWHANFLVKNDGLEGVLDTNSSKALEIYRELAWGNDDITITSLARCSAVPLLIKGKYSGQLAAKDEAMVRQYVDNWQEMSSHHYYDLARFYSDGIESTDYSSSEYERAREILKRGMENSASPESRQKCEALLEKWGVKPVPPLPPTITQKVAEGAKVTVSLGYILAVLIIWSFIGTTLLAIATRINLYIGLPIIALLVIGGIIATLRRG